MANRNHTVSRAYAFGQLERALRSADANPARIARWQAVLTGMADGTLTVGSRTPVAGTPAWVTLEVAHGGFATGRYLAEVEPSEDELAALPDGVPGTTARERLNLWYLTDAGQAALLDALTTGDYRVEVPEDSALLTVAWLLAHGHEEAALDVVAELRPLMHRLRMTPRFTKSVAPQGTAVRVASVGEVGASLRAITVDHRLAAMLETLRVWHPLYDRLVELWCDTVDGELPHLADGTVVGGWPCREWPDDWVERRARWLADYDAAAGGRAVRPPKSNFARLRAALLESERDSSALSARDVGWVRRAIANTVTRHGAPGSERRVALRAIQHAVAARPTYAALAAAMADRLDAFPADGGLPELEPVARDAPPHLVAKVTRALEAPVEELVERGVITSGEVLATVLPQMTSSLMAAGIADPDLATVYARAYAAFRRRRSLLLLDLEHQVRFEELPWIGALEPLRAPGSADAAVAARRTLEQTFLLALHAFPQAILPNPLVRELGALATRSDLELPLVEEVAADIFMGRFTLKWHTAATITSQVMAGTLYARYYDLPVSWPEPVRKRFQHPRTAEHFGQVCEKRAAEAGRGRNGVARNGAVLEQSQILTTHNLAVLVDALGLGERITALAPELATRTLDWVVERMSVRTDTHHARLIAVKNCAYAWRQAVFFLSHCDQATQETAVDRLPTTGPLAPAVAGLAAVVGGARFDAAGRIGKGRRFLGWGVGGHWAIPEQH
jgi:hypothetical protein